MNSYIEMLQYFDTIINLEMTANFVVIVWLVGLGVKKLWKIVA
jgi:hypothetical protein